MFRFANATGGKRAGTAVGLGIAVALMSTSAWSQCTTANTGGAFPVTNIGELAVPPGAAAAAIGGAIGNVNTVFLTQQGSAFVSAPANPAPNQEGGGVWVRGVGGQVDIKNSSTSNNTITSTGAPNPNPAGTVLNTSQTNCSNTERATFGGAQVGADIARLNWNGWNIHLGSTAGYLGLRSTNSYGFTNNFDVPFLGTYLVATYGRFFADIMIRNEYYNITLNNPGFIYFNQPVGAHGYSVSTSAGYNFALQNNWFLEPSAGFVYSRTKVDDFTNSGTPNLLTSGVISTNDITSEIGRLSLRAGTVIATPNIVWQPFASASVFHEFAGNVTSSYASLANTNFTGGGPSLVTQGTSTSRVGTYGQFSVGVAGQVVNTGWLGFVRVDYRTGNNIEGWTGNAGLRYQFTPGAMDAMAADMPLKVKAPKIAYTTNWTGFYVGGFFGGDAGRTTVGFVGTPVPTSTRPWVFGPLGGGQAGYNWQAPSSPWVFGVEGDIGAANIKGARQCGTDPQIGLFGPTGGLASAYFTCGDKTDWVATATARVGYASGRTLYYVRGGAAFEDSTVSANCILGPTGSAINPVSGAVRNCTNQAGVIQTNITKSDRTRTGYLLGFGTEFDLGKGWSAKTEYNYIDFGRSTAVASDAVSTLTDKAYTSQVKVGVNYRFGGPIVARY